MERVEEIVYNTVVYGGLLFSLFLILFYNSFYPVEAFLMAFLLARLCLPFFSQKSGETVVLVSVLMSMMLYLSDESIHSDHKSLLGIQLNKPLLKNTIYVFMILVVAGHVFTAQRKGQAAQETVSALVSGIVIGYTGFSVCRRTRKNDPCIPWFATRITLSLIILTIFLTYMYKGVLLNQSSMKTYSKK